jgi:hypothetical protein
LQCNDTLSLQKASLSQLKFAFKIPYLDDV